MTAITILPEKIDTVETRYRALAGETESTGRSVGEALDALTSQLEGDEAGLLVVIQSQIISCLSLTSKYNDNEGMPDVTKTDCNFQ